MSRRVRNLRLEHLAEMLMTLAFKLEEDELKLNRK